MRVTGTFGTLDRAEPVHRAPEPPELPDPDACVPATRGSSPVATAIVMLDRLDVRVDPSTIGFAVGRPSRRGRDPGLVADAPTAASRMPRCSPIALDALMPVSFDLGVPGWAPTIELTGQAARSARARAGCVPSSRPTRSSATSSSRTPRSGTPPAASSRGPDSSPACGCRPTSLLGCPQTARSSPRSRALAELPGIPEQVEAAREACTRLRWHQALRKRIPEAAAESRVRGAARERRARGRERPRGRTARHRARAPSTWSPAPGPGRAARCAACSRRRPRPSTSPASCSPHPLQALARLHTAAAIGLVDPAALGRPRMPGEDCRELADLGPAPAADGGDGTAAGSRRGAAGDPPATGGRGCGPRARGAGHRASLHAGNAVVARALDRAVVHAGGLDPTGVAVTEAGHGGSGGRGLPRCARGVRPW